MIQRKLNCVRQTQKERTKSESKSEDNLHSADRELTQYKIVSKSLLVVRSGILLPSALAISFIHKLEKLVYKD